MWTLAGSKLLSIRWTLRRYLMKILRYYPRGLAIQLMVVPKSQRFTGVLPLKVLQASTRGKAVYSKIHRCLQSRPTNRKSRPRLLWTCQSRRWESLQSQSLIRGSLLTINTSKSWLRARQKMRMNPRSALWCSADPGSNPRMSSHILPMLSNL